MRDKLHDEVHKAKLRAPCNLPVERQSAATTLTPGQRGTKRQAQIECARLIPEMNGGIYLEPSKTTLAQSFDRWLDHMKSQISPKSHSRYSELARKNLAPLLGSVVLTKLRPAAISAAYSKALTEGRREAQADGTPLQPDTLTQDWFRKLADTPLPRIRFHDFGQLMPRIC
ncbi:hypothetical protein ACF1BQ_010360 [Bradyrhizobium sp. RDT10]